MNASGRISGSSSGRPKVMLRPVIARTMKQVAVIQWTKRSNALKRTIVRPERPLSSHHHAAQQIEDDQQRQHADDGDGADPAQRHLVELPPVAARRAGSSTPDSDVRESCRDPESDLSSLQQLLLPSPASAVGLTEARLLRAEPGPPARRSHSSANAPTSRRIMREELRHAHLLCLQCLAIRPAARRAGRARHVAFRTRSSPCRRSASPRRRSRSRAWPRAPCRSGR